MSLTTDPNVLLIYGLIFVLGLLIGVFLTAGGRRKWRERYNSESERRRELERAHTEREKHWADQEKDWRERDSLRAAAVKSGRDPADDRPL
jgi:predicted histidine transporter YuiF (NhaC family)